MKDLYIVHGWTYRPEPWEEVVKDLKKRGIEAELLRVPGLATKTDEVYTIDDYAEWAAKNIPKGAIALGHSNGGRILLNMVTKTAPKQLSGLILLDAAGIYEPSKKNELMRKMSKAFAPLKKIKILRNGVHKLLRVHDYNDAPENMKKTMTNMLDSDKTLDISKVAVPTRIIWGTDDQMTPLRQGKKMHELIKGSKISIKEGWRHSHYLRSSDELAEEIAKQYKDLKNA